MISIQISKNISSIYFPLLFIDIQTTDHYLIRFLSIPYYLNLN